MSSTFVIDALYIHECSCANVYVCSIIRCNIVPSEQTSPYVCLQNGICTKMLVILNVNVLNTKSASISTKTVFIR